MSTILTLTVALAASAATIFAQSPARFDQDEGRCSNHTLKGAYAMQISGTGRAPSGQAEITIGVLIRVFDGAGKFTQFDYVKGTVSGLISNGPGSGTYSLDQNCMGEVTLNVPGLPFQVTERMVVMDRGREFRTANADPVDFLFITGVGKKVW